MTETPQIPMLVGVDPEVLGQYSDYAGDTARFIDLPDGQLIITVTHKGRVGSVIIEADDVDDLILKLIAKRMKRK